MVQCTSAYRRTDDVSRVEVALERSCVHWIGLKRRFDNKASLLEAQRQSASASENVKQTWGGRHLSGTLAIDLDVERRSRRHDAVVGAEVDVVVLGAGPAGLAAAVAAVERGLSCIVIERGDLPSERNRGRPADLVSGVGGAGLYSDGKFSFAPSATALWMLKPDASLRESYEWVATLLREHGVHAPPFPSDPTAEAKQPRHLKPYPSEYMSLKDRLRLVDSLSSRAGTRLVVGSGGSFTPLDDGVLVESGGNHVHARAVVIATGRFGPLAGPKGLPRCYRRVEIGMRVEQEADSFALDAAQFGRLLDPKWVQRSPDGRFEWRTFCCCRRGEVVWTQFGDLRTVSGRADGPATTRSNFGLNVRFLDANEGLDALDRALNAAQGPGIQIEAGDLLEAPLASSAAALVGQTTAVALAEGLKALAGDVGESLGNATLYLPALEGVGYYPHVDDTLRVAPAVWAAGDATGAVRGLVPALVTGRMASIATSVALGRE